MCCHSAVGPPGTAVYQGTLLESVQSKRTGWRHFKVLCVKTGLVYKVIQVSLNVLPINTLMKIGSFSPESVGAILLLLYFSGGPLWTIQPDSPCFIFRVNSEKISKESSHLTFNWSLEEWHHVSSVWLTALVAGAETPPPRHLAHCPVAGTLGRKQRRSHISVQSCWSAQFDQHDVGVLCARVVVWVADELGRHDVLLRPVLLPDVVLSESNLYIRPRRNKKKTSVKDALCLDSFSFQQTATFQVSEHNWTLKILFASELCGCSFDRNMFVRFLFCFFSIPQEMSTYFVLQWAAESTHSSDRRVPPQKLYPVKRDTW